ncbi:hypothetical protein [Cohnella soli]|uniref:Uncharacterized protein n=1 Tax=Cohnella soli TaxID=425005 RepID=A0ABW0HM71_9BACL
MNVAVANEETHVKEKVQLDIGYKTIWCRLENGGYWLFRSRPAPMADLLVREFNEQVEPGRRYYAFPMGFNAKTLGPNYFAPILLQAMEDHLQHPDDEKNRRIKEEVVGLAITQHGMTRELVDVIEQEIAAVYNQSRGGW